jgi:hypothetical protein
MEAYGQFAWKLRHYRRGPPESNHSSNGPVCRHLGGRLAGIPYSLSLSFFLSPIFRHSHLRLVFNRVSTDADSYSADVPSSLIRRGCSDYAEVSPPDHCGFIDTGNRAGRSDLETARPIDVNDRAAVSPIGELNGEAESLASRAPFGQIRFALGNGIAREHRHSE